MVKAQADLATTAILFIMERRELSSPGRRISYPKISQASGMRKDCVELPLGTRNFTFYSRRANKKPNKSITEHAHYVTSFVLPAGDGPPLGKQRGGKQRGR